MRLWWALLPLAPAVLAQSGNDTESLLWGAYRPNLYFGLRPRIPQSLMTGLLWFGTQDYQSLTRQSGCMLPRVPNNLLLQVHAMAVIRVTG